MAEAKKEEKVVPLKEGIDEEIADLERQLNERMSYIAQQDPVCNQLFGAKNALLKLKDKE